MESEPTAEVVSIFKNKPSHDAEDTPDQTVTWHPTEAPGSLAAHSRILEILFSPRPDDLAV